MITKTERFLFSAYPAIMIIVAYGFVRLSEHVKDKRLAYLLLALVVAEFLFKHFSFYYNDIADQWIIGRHYTYYLPR